MFTSQLVNSRRGIISCVSKISEINRDVMETMSNQELAEAIANARLPFLREPDNERLPLLDRNTLERLVYLARQYCV